MSNRTKLLRFTAASTLLLLVGIGTFVQAQQKPDETAKEKMMIQATAKGTSTQMGRMANINIYIDSLSTPEDQQALIQGFKTSGQDGMVKALSKMKSKGRVSFPSTTGNEVKYIRELPAEGGARRFRLVTDRTIAFVEARESTRSQEYSIGAIELTITPDGKGSGTLLPATKLKVNKNKELEIESYQNPWKLDNFIISKRD